MSQGMPHDSPRVLMELARAGSEEAARELIEVYGPHLRRAVRKQMDPRLRGQFDSDDFMQEVWQRFFANLDKLSEVDQPRALVAFLSKLARNQITDACRKFCPRHHPDPKQSLSDPTGQGSNDPPAKQPSASQIFEAKELEERLRHGQSPLNQEILDGLKQGGTHQELARSLGVSERTVRRVIERLKPFGSQP